MTFFRKHEKYYKFSFYTGVIISFILVSITTMQNDIYLISNFNSFHNPYIFVAGELFLSFAFFIVKTLLFSFVIGAIIYVVLLVPYLFICAIRK